VAILFAIVSIAICLVRFYVRVIRAKRYYMIEYTILAALVRTSPLNGSPDLLLTELLKGSTTWFGRDSVQHVRRRCNAAGKPGECHRG